MIKALYTRIMKWYLHYHISKNGFSCKFCVYSIDVTDIYKCTRYNMPTDTIHICRNFVLWSESIKIYGETTPLEIDTQ